MSSSTNTESTFSVEEPFNANEYADLVLRSSDDHKFHVIKVLLSMTSTIFKDMVSIPSPPPPSHNGESEAQHLPVVDISESSIVIDALLRYIYPVDDPSLTLELAFDVLLAAEKYEMHRVSQWAKNAFKALCLGKNLDESVLRVYSLACTHHLLDEARYAARGSLEFCLSDPRSIRSLSLAPTRAVLNLMRYHNEVTKRIVGLFSRLSEWPLKSSDLIILCSNAKSPRIQYNTPFQTTHEVPAWWYNIQHDMTIAISAMSCGPLSTNTISQDKLEGRISINCNHCKWCKHKGADQLHKALRARMIEIADMVKFEIPWDVP